MSSIEERLARDIAAVTGGVVVTESDLRNARDAVDERIDSRAAARPPSYLSSPQPRRRGDPRPGRRRAPDTRRRRRDGTTREPGADEPADLRRDFLTGSAPTPELLEGVWRVDNGTVLLRFTADGAIQFDDEGRCTPTRRASAPTRSPAT